MSSSTSPTHGEPPISQDEKHSTTLEPTHNQNDDGGLLGKKSPGVQRIEAIADTLTKADRICLFLGIFLIAYAYTLDGTLRYAYQPAATSSFANHSLLSTVNTLRGVIAAAAQPTAAKIADVFGRLEYVFSHHLYLCLASVYLLTRDRLVLISVLFYVVGTIVEALSHNVSLGFVAFLFCCISRFHELIID